MTTATKRRSGGPKNATGITIPYGELHRAVKIAAHPINGRARSPVLQNICLGDSKVSGSNDDYRVDVDVAAAVFPPVLLRKDRLLSILNNSKDMPGGEEVSLFMDGDCVVVQIGQGEWRLPTEDASLYPQQSTDGLEPMVAMPAEAFSRSMKSVIYAIDRESSRYALGGVLIECIDDKAFFVATDGRRLSVAECGREGAQDDFVTNPKDQQKRAPIVPKEPLTQLMNQCSGLSDVVTLLFGNGKFVGQVGDVSVTAATIEGRFPDWRGLFDDPKDMKRPHVIDRESLSKATRCAGVVATEDSRGVLFRFGGETLTLTAKASTAGESKVECPVSAIGEPAKVKVDPLFVTQFLSSFASKNDDPNVSVYVSGPGEKVLLCVDDAYKAIIMPMAEDA